MKYAGIYEITNLFADKKRAFADFLSLYRAGFTNLIKHFIMKTHYFYMLSCLLLHVTADAQQKPFKDKFDDAIPVLNFGTFHMGYTPDATKVDFDKKDKRTSRRYTLWQSYWQYLNPPLS